MPLALAETVGILHGTDVVGGPLLLAQVSDGTGARVRCGTACLSGAQPPVPVATTLDHVHTDVEPNGASVTLSGNGQLAVASVTALGDGTPRIVMEFPNLRSNTPADIIMGQGPVSMIHVTTSGITPSTRVVIDLLRPASYRVIPGEGGVKDLKIILDDTVRDEVSASPAVVARLTDPIAALLASPRNAGVPGRAPLAQQQPTTPVPPLPPPIDTGMPQPGTPQPRFNGHPVTLDFQGADLRTVLRTFADISGLNIVIDQSVDDAERAWSTAIDRYFTRRVA